MNAIDFLIVLPVGYFAYKGFMKGFIKEFFGFAGLIIAIFVTFNFMGPVSGFTRAFVQNTDSAVLVTGILIFFLTLAAVQVTAFWLDRVFTYARLGIVNAVSGALFGGLKMALLVSAMLLLFAGFDKPNEKNREGSLTYSTAITIAPAAFNLVASIYPQAVSFVETIEKSIRENNTLRSLPLFNKPESES
ncbi:MAG: CvpA family protein [Balneolaceae bacterium]|nr:MAG: CvpA family protein [Balneolaceae bacterium]